MAGKRQIIFLMTDTTRWDMLGCYGNGDMHTPNLDALAARGTRFERAYTCQPVCGPARSAIFTGLYPHSNGGWTNSVALNADVKTLGQRLTDAGVHCGYIGKWHLDGGDYFGNGVCPPGWDADYWYDMRCYLEELTEEERRYSRVEGNPVKPEFTYGYRVADRAVRFLQENGGEDFFLTVSLDEPHGPSLCPEPFASMYENYEFPKSANIWDDLQNKPPHQRAWAGENLKRDADALKLTPRYLLGCNAFADQQLGRVIDAAREMAPEAMIVFTSDHGDFIGSHALSGKGPAGYDEICRIPLIVAGGAAQKGRVYPHPVSHIDLAPTLLRYMGVASPTLPGHDLAPALAGGAEPVDEQVFFEFGRYEVDHDGFGGFQPMRAAFDGRYKLVINLLGTDELYDLREDPCEMENLIGREDTAAVRDALHDRILEMMNRTRDPFRGYYWERRPWRADARPATWDYTGYTRQKETEPGEARQLDYDTGMPMVEATRFKKV